MKIKNIVFDIGNVLFAYNPEKIVDILIPGSIYKKEYIENLFSASIWTEKLDRGLVTDSEVEAELAGSVDFNPQKVKDLHFLYKNWVYHLDVIKKSKEIFLKLYEQQYPLYILSNFQDKPFDKLIEKESFLKVARGIVVSAKINMAKPDKQIYSYLLEKFNLKAEESLFIDDKTENIEACKNAGMKGIVFTTPDKLLKELKLFDINLN